MHTPRSFAIPLLAVIAAACAADTPTAIPDPALAGAATAAAPSVTSARMGAMRSSATVNWHAQQTGLGNHLSGPVAGASASLVRSVNGIAFQISSTQLVPGNAYTLWLVVINNPAACATVPCSAGDIILNAATRAQVRYAAGSVAGMAGQATFAGGVQEGPLSGWLPDRTFEDASAAEVHLVINDHGPMLPEYMPDMIRTYRGGCSDQSPFPGVFPATALADGVPGPNRCLLYQAAVFLAPAQPTIH